MAEPDSEALMEVAERLLDVEQLAKVSVRIEDGEIKRVQVYLLGFIDAKMAQGELSPAQLADIMPKLGLSTRDIERIRTDNADKFIS